MQENKDIINNPGSSVLDDDGNVIVFDKSNPPKVPFLGRRFIEIFVSSIICSVPIALMYQFGFTRTFDWALRLFGFSVFVFVILNAYLLRAFYYSMGSKQVYFRVNFIAYTIFAVVGIAVLLTLGDSSLTSLFSYLFMPQKFMQLIFSMTVNTGGRIAFQILSSLCIYILMLLTMLIAPAEMYSFDKKKGER